MFCTEENRKTCRDEKLGCEGCFYNNDKNNNKKSFIYKLQEKYCNNFISNLLENLIKGYEIMNKLKSQYYIETKAIKIQDDFEKNPPLDRKMARKWRYYRETGKLSSPIILNEEFYLIDGYTSYLIAKADGLKTVEVEIRKEK